MSKIVYLFDGLDNSLNGEWNCQESPLEPGVYIIPKMSTSLKPPTFDNTTSRCIWKDSFWDIELIEQPVPQPNTAEQNKAEASQLLTQTDWVNQPDVTDTSKNPHLLNKVDFDLYRQQLRVIAVYPTAGNLTWPVKPESQWSQV